MRPVPALFAEQPALVNNVDCDALPASLRVKMEDPEQYSQVAAVLKGQPGIDQIVDQSAFLDRLFAVTRVFRVGVLLVAFVMLVSASILIANTVRMGLFARRKEIGIMKLVGRDQLADPAPVPRRGAVREPDRGDRGDPVPVRDQGRVHRATRTSPSVHPAGS